MANPLIFMVGQGRIELPTPGFSVRKVSQTSISENPCKVRYISEMTLNNAFPSMFNYMQLDLIKSMHNHYRNRYSGGEIGHFGLLIKTFVIIMKRVFKQHRIR